MKKNSQLTLLLHVLNFLGSHRIHPYVFGGWAEELQQLAKSRPHKDIDLLYVSKNFRKVDNLFKTSRKIREIKEKRFFHKRAFIYENTLVELFLVQKGLNGNCTRFWDDYELCWPKQIFTSVQVSNSQKIRIINSEGLSFYRLNYPFVEKARKKYYQFAE